LGLEKENVIFLVIQTGEWKKCGGCTEAMTKPIVLLILKLINRLIYPDTLFLLLIMESK